MDVDLIATCYNVKTRHHLQFWGGFDGESSLPRAVWNITTAFLRQFALPRSRASGSLVRFLGSDVPSTVLNVSPGTYIFSSPS